MVKNTKQHPDESYEDSFQGRGQEMQDEEDRLAGRMESQLELDNPPPKPGTLDQRPGPTPDQFGTQEEFEEAQSRWRWTVGRNRALREQALKDLQRKTLDQTPPSQGELDQQNSLAEKMAAAVREIIEAKLPAAAPESTPPRKPD